jgi:SPP1 gp7 family putative phage head morphogenesis protein
MGSGMKNLMANNGVVARGISDTTLERMGDLIAKGIQEGSSYKQISKSLQEVISSPVRADIIAITETTRAFNTSSIDFYQEAQLPGWEWVAYAGACPKCQAQAGPKQFKDPHPPGHPSCRCSVIPLMDSYLTNPGDRTTPKPSTTVRKPRTSRPASNATPTDLPSVAQQTPGMITEDVPWVPSMTEEQAVDWSTDTMYTYLDDTAFRINSEIGFTTDVTYESTVGGIQPFGNGAIAYPTKLSAEELQYVGYAKNVRQVQVKLKKIASMDQSRAVYEEVINRAGGIGKWNRKSEADQAMAIHGEATYKRGYDAIRPKALVDYYKSNGQNVTVSNLRANNVSEDVLVILNQQDIVLVKANAPILTETSLARQIDHLYEPFMERFSFEPGHFTTMDPKEIQMAINPYYGLDNSFSVNCARVVENYELRRRGYVVEANNGKNIGSFTRNNDQIGMTYIRKAWVQEDGSKPQTFQANTYKKVKTKIRETIIEDMKANGVVQEGNRGFLQMDHKKANVGHVINWEVKNGEVVFIDAQTGKIWDASYSSWGDMNNYNYTRIDNLRPTATVLRFINRPGEVPKPKPKAPKATNSSIFGF